MLLFVVKVFLQVDEFSKFVYSLKFKLLCECYSLVDVFTLVASETIE